MTIASTWEIKPLSAALGAEVRGVNLSRISAAEAQVVESLLVENQVLFFPDQHLSVEEHVRFGRLFGELEGHPHLENPFTEHPEIFELAASQGGIADEWHTDLTFLPEPALLSVLQMKQCPDVGGDTMWSSLFAAYDALSDPMKELCEGLTALHDALPHGQPEKMAIHPVVRVHPVSGKKALYVNEHFTRRIVELNAEESNLLLGHLTRWVARPTFTVRYRWSPGTVAMWDNRATQHCVLNDFEGERIIQRVTIVGDQPKGGPARWKPCLPDRLSAVSRHDRQLARFLREQKDR